MAKDATIVWLRQDLRLDDQPALATAVAAGGPVVPVFIWAPDEEGAWPPGGASKWWLRQSLAQLQRALEKLGSRLILRMGESQATLLSLAKEVNAATVVWNRRYEPAIIARDTKIKNVLREHGLRVDSHNGSLLFEPWTVATRQATPFQVFTPFWKACLALPEPPSPIPAPTHLPAPSKWPKSCSLADLKLEPTIDWAAGIRAAWKPGEAGAFERLAQFFAQAVGTYSVDRDRPNLDGTSRLAPYLHFGEISPRRVWHEVRRQLRESKRDIAAGSEVFLREIGWREFAYHLLFHFSHSPEQPLRQDFSRFPWRDDPVAFRAWRRGRTGYPLVDAGMRQLWISGSMHNRVRMVVASFLVKDLLIRWQDGAAWFWDTLVCADLANNTLGWQWTAGCGADAAPYFRIFNPISQGQKFDPQGDYVRKWVPELAALPAAWIHKPWEAPLDVLDQAGVTLGKTYPHPIIDHGFARKRALDALATIAKS
jgi:deoxyribodipyrimidine photo-lyase